MKCYCYVYEEYRNIRIFNNYWNDLEEYKGYCKIESEFVKGLNYDKSNMIHLYTDASKKGDSVVLDGLNRKIIDKSYMVVMNNFEALELELVAIFVELIMIQANSKVEVYMDSLVVVNIWRTLFLEDELKWETRKIWNINSIGLWKMMYRFVKEDNLDVLMMKVKSHSDDEEIIW
ncbi:hypothetical protein RhiirA5_413919 [Rhizophagus irregularis]|uniref:RNase H type-1 domain-containing protein n=1 Tax=Rhizophagus irregularis TaxID=588596 RepID=A0A2N0PVH4_9GLOM|nr:hypothetical protein RhiirA5_413919 [Rhizophagus irregularis]